MSVKLRIRHLDLGQTLGCGQTFRWEELGPNAWRGPIGDSLVTLRMEGEWLRAESIPDVPDLRRRVFEYLRVGDDTERIMRELSRDPVMARGVESVSGLRLVKMDEWECLASYILATFTNIERISRMIRRLSSRYGEPITRDVRTFPSVDRLAEAPVRELRALGLGYRAEYLAETCEAMDEGRLEKMRRMSDDELREELLTLRGVGDKVADCVSLFGFGRLRAFPIDVWMKRALQRLYGEAGSYRHLREFAAERFGPHAGYAQEYLFYNERALSGAGGCVFTRRGGSSGRTPQSPTRRPCPRRTP